MTHDALSRQRTVVLAGHAGSGKTTLAEHLLFATGAVTRLGAVDDGTAALDADPEEQKRHLTLSLHVAGIRHDDHRITIVDTPGYADFVGEMISGFGAADAAVRAAAGQHRPHARDLPAAAAEHGGEHPLAHCNCPL